MIEPKRKLLLWPMSQSAAPTVVACAGINGTACPPCERAMARNETLRPARAPPDDEWAGREHSPELRAGPSSRLRVRPPAQDAQSSESSRRVGVWRPMQPPPRRLPLPLAASSIGRLIDRFVATPSLRSRPPTRTNPAARAHRSVPLIHRRPGGAPTSVLCY